jgi:hypothetical protein
MSDMLKSEPFLEQCSYEPWCTVDEKDGVGNIVFLSKFAQR